MQKLTYQFKLIRAIRNFFEEQNFLDVITPPVVENPGMEVHIHPFEVGSAYSSELTKKYLHTSPEFHMKKLLASREDFQNIFTIGYVFRDEPISNQHRTQFLMLEWYRKNAYYSQIMDDVESLIRHIQDSFENDNNILKPKINSFQRVTVKDFIFEHAAFNILDFLDKDDLKNKIKKDFKSVPLPEVECSWDDYYFLFFLNIIEPCLKNYPYLLLHEFPAPLSALSTLKTDDPNVCERFEVYLSGIELCNAFNELTNYQELQQRFELQAKEKSQLYSYELPWPNEFMQMMKAGYPKSSGIALGVERLYMSLFKVDNPFFE